MYFKRVLKLCLARNLEWAWASETASVSIIAVTLWDQGHLLQVLRQELGAKEHQKNLNQAQEEAVSWQIAKKKRVKRTLKTNLPQPSFPPPMGKICSEKDQTKKKYWRQNTQKNTPCFSDERCRNENVNKRVRGWTSEPRSHTLLSWRHRVKRGTRSNLAIDRS